MVEGHEVVTISELGNLTNRFRLPTSLSPRGEEVAITHWTRLGTERVENKKTNVLNEHPANPDPLQPARFCPTSQHRTNSEQQSQQLGTYQVVRLPSLKAVAVKVNRQPSHHGECKGRRENNATLSL